MSNRKSSDISSILYGASDGILSEHLLDNSIELLSLLNSIKAGETIETIDSETLNNAMLLAEGLIRLGVKAERGFVA
ncbi:TPA: hypothetical protein ACX6RY_001985 [Photobacterium damselae]